MTHPLTTPLPWYAPELRVPGEPESTDCTCTFVEPGFVQISPLCEIHAHLLFEEPR